MSTWTQVCGSIRISRSDKTDPIPNFGKIINYGDLDWRESNMPMGSEGSLKYKVVLESSVDKPENHCKNDSLSVAIFGDLRDFGADEFNKILEWVKLTFDQKKMPRGFYIDQGVFNVVCGDYSHNIVYSGYFNQTWEVIKNDNDL